MADLSDKMDEYLEQQPNAHVKLNVMVRWLRASVPMFRVIDRDLTAPPGSPNDGDLYLVATSPTGDWSGHAGHLALYYSDLWGTNGWDFVIPTEGYIARILDENLNLFYDGASWSAI